MEHVENDIIYDTDIADKVCGDIFCDAGDFGNHYDIDSELTIKVSLYLTQKGNWFLCEEDNEKCLFLKSLTIEDTYKWLRDINEPDLLKKYFPDRIEE